MLILEWLSGGLANAISSSLLNPMDVSKTRMQAELITGNGTKMNNITITRTIYNLYLEGGIVGLWSPGLSASIAREMLYSGPRSGFYVPLRDAISKRYGHNGESNLFCKILTAMATGTLGAVIANPVDLIKVRMMVTPTRYTSLIHGLGEVYKREGLHGLYKGVVPSTLRGAFIAAGELATYDHAKTSIKHYFHVEEGYKLHTISSLVTGLVATTVAAPFDLIKTRYINIVIRT